MFCFLSVRTSMHRISQNPQQVPWPGPGEWRLLRSHSWLFPRVSVLTVSLCVFRQVIVEKVSGSQIVDIDKRKYLVPSDITVAQFMWIIRKRIQLPSEKAIFLFVDKTVPQSRWGPGRLGDVNHTMTWTTRSTRRSAQITIIHILDLVQFPASRPKKTIYWRVMDGGHQLPTFKWISRYFKFHKNVTLNWISTFEDVTSSFRKQCSPFSRPNNWINW